jgi:hypothetical protein
MESRKIYFRRMGAPCWHCSGQFARATTGVNRGKLVCIEVEIGGALRRVHEMCLKDALATFEDSASYVPGGQNQTERSLSLDEIEERLR